MVKNVLVHLFGAMGKNTHLENFDVANSSAKFEKVEMKYFQQSNGKFSPVWVIKVSNMEDNSIIIDAETGEVIN